MFALLETFFTQFGYAAVFFVLVLCGFGIPIPEDVTLIAGGVISGLGYTNEHIMFAVGMAGVLVGDGIMFLLGKYFGETILKFRPIKKLMTAKRYAQVQAKFDRYGNWVLFVARFLPGLRSPIFITAGMSGKISFWQWLIMDGLAALISVPLWVYLGFLGVNNKEWMFAKMHQFQYGLYILIAALAIGLFWVYKKKRAARLAKRDQLLAKRQNRQRNFKRS